MTKGYIYIMTNPCLKDMVKIGYATDVEARRRQLSTTALPYEYEVYAVYETPGNLEDKKLHRLIDSLNPDLRVSKNREFYIMKPEDAYGLLETIAIISGSQSRLQLMKRKVTGATEERQAIRRPSINFYECGLKDGDELVCIEDHTVRAVVAGERKVLYREQFTSLTAIMKEIKGVSAIAGPKYFTFNGENLLDIADRTQWRGNTDDEC